MEKEGKKKRKRKNISIPCSLAEGILKFIDEHPELYLKRSFSLRERGSQAQAYQIETASLNS